MLKRLRCQKGHQWELTSDRPGGDPLTGNLCPECSNAAETVQALGQADDPTFPLPSAEGAPPAALPVVPGFEILAELGRGGMGVVYKARHVLLNRLVALKMIVSGAYAGAEERARFRAEAETAARIQHPNIVQVFEVGEHQGQPYVALEFVPGGSLADKLDGTPRLPKQAALLVETLARAVHAAHEAGVVHRDLKPANVLVGDRWVLKVADFGLAKRLDSSIHTSTGVILGTPSYMAPEQAGGKNKEVGPAADVYALGAILYELLTGRPPFRGATSLETVIQVQTEEPVPPSRLNRKTTRDLETVCLKCLQKQPRKRYGTAQELAEDLARIGRGEPIQARPVGRVERTWRWCRRNPVVAALLVVMAGLLALSTVGFVNAELNRRAAEENFAAAEQNFAAARQTVGQFVTDISREELAAFPGLQEVRQKFAQRAIDRFEEFTTRRPNDPEVRFGLANARGALGVIVASIGSFDTGVKELERAIALHAKNVEDHPGNAEYRLALSRARFELAILFWGVSQNQDARPPLEKAIEDLEKLAAERPGDTEVKFTLARAFNSRGNLGRETGKGSAGKADYERSLALFKEVLPSYPRKVDCLMGLAGPLHNLSLIAKGERDYKKALELLDQSQKYDQEAMALSPQSPILLSNASIGLSNRASLLNLMKRVTEARRDFDESVRLSRVVVRDNPKVSRFRWLLAEDLREYAAFRSSQGEFEASRQAYEESCQILDELTWQGDDRPIYGEKLIASRLALAEFHQGAKGPGMGARDEKAYQAALDQAVRSARRLAAKHPKAAGLNFQFAKALHQRALPYADANQDEMAFSLLLESVQVYERSLGTNAKDADPYQTSDFLGFAVSAVQCANRLAKREKVVEIADLAYKVGNSCAEREGVQRLADILATRGLMQKKEERNQDAINAYQLVIKVAKPVFDKATWHWYLRANVGTAYLNLSELHQRVGDIPNEVWARQQYLKVWGGPILGMETKGLIDPDPPASAGEATRLRAVMAKLPSMKRFTIPAIFNGLKYNFHVYISNVPWPKDPLEDQARWLEEERGGTIPEEIRESFRKLHKIAHDNKVPFVDLCVEALGKKPEGKKPESDKGKKK